jgi:long-subunit acyl-CoA synthetase (AMP-forming)
VANISSIMHMSDTVKGMEWVRGGEVHMSFLPMAHAMERSVQTLMVVLGGCVGYSQGIREKIMDDIKVLRCVRGVRGGGGRGALLTRVFMQAPRFSPRCRAC